MGRARRLAARVLPLLVAGYTLYATGSGYLSWASRPRGSAVDVATVYDELYRGVRRELRKRGIDRVGYLYLAPEGSPRFSGDHLMTQYALSPVVVYPSVEHPFVLGRFRDRRFMRSGKVPEELSVVAKLGRGIVLYRNEGLP